MVTVIKNALADREHPLDKNREIYFDGYKLILSHRNTKRIIDQLKQRQGTHNQKRQMFRRSIINELISQYKKQMVHAYQNTSIQKQISNKNSTMEPGSRPVRNLANKVIDPEIAKKIIDKQHIPEVWLEKMDDRLKHHDEIKIAIERMWPALSGAELYHDLFS